jgi:hypothetical protein
MKYVIVKGTNFKAGEIIPKGSIISYKNDDMDNHVLCLLMFDVEVESNIPENYPPKIILCEEDGHVNYKGLYQAHGNYNIINVRWFSVFMEEDKK